MGDAWLSILQHDGTRNFVRLTLALTTLGRSEQNVIELLDPKLSRFHCEIERHRDGYTVRDCNSRNGTLVNGDPVAGPRLLQDGDRVKIGRTLITFHAERPEELRYDDAVELRQVVREEGPVTEQDTPPTAVRRPTESLVHPDRRQTQTLQAIESLGEKPWQFLGRVGLAVLDAGSRGELLEVALEEARGFLQAGGALLVLGRSADAMTITASLGVDAEGKQRCMNAAERVLTSQAPTFDDRRVLGLPVRSAAGVEGALVLHDLAGALGPETPPVVALQALADLVGRTVTGSLRLEEVRRDERAAGARRIGEDLRRLLEPSSPPQVPGLEVGVAVVPGDEVGRDVWDCVVAPSRAGRREVYLLLGDVPDAGAPPPKRLRRRGERGFVSLLGRAELRGALRAMVAVLPRTSDLLVELNHALRRDGAVDREALLLCRYDPVSGALRLAGAGHAPALMRRVDGSVEQLAALAPALGVEEDLKVAELELRWERGDQLLLASAEAHACAGEPLERLFARMGAPGIAVEQVAARLADALRQQQPSEGGAGFTLLLLRRA